MINLLFLLLPFLGPDTDILVVSKSCESCVEAKIIIKKLQDEGYDVIIVSKRSPIGYRFKVFEVPTLIIRDSESIPEKIVGLLSEDEYRYLINRKQNNE